MKEVCRANNNLECVKCTPGPCDSRDDENTEDDGEILEFTGTLSEQIDKSGVSRESDSSVDIRLINNKTGDILYKTLTIGEIEAFLIHVPNQEWWRDACRMEDK